MFGLTGAITIDNIRDRRKEGYRLVWKLSIKQPYIFLD